MDGILVVDKPRGLTSHDIVARVRRMARQKRVGHAGTLDPLATGVLVVCLGQATRVAEYLAGSVKVYRGRVRLGIETDTQDAEGQSVAERPVTVSAEDVERELVGLRGPIMQVPPMYSALKRGGQTLYDLARQGITIERAPRPVEIRELTLTEWAPPELELFVRCTAGTYVRTLAHDLGTRLGCGAHLIGLRREASGVLTLAQAVTLEQLEAEVGTAAWAAHCVPIVEALVGWPRVVLTADGVRRVRQGQVVAVAVDAAQDALACALDEAGGLIGLVRVDGAQGVVRPEKIFGLGDA